MERTFLLHFPQNGNQKSAPLKHGRHPNDVNAQALQVVHLGDDAGDVPKAVPVAILEAGWVDLAIA